MYEIDKVLTKDEKVLWRGRPRFAPFAISPLVLSFVGWAFLIGGAMLAMMGAKTSDLLIFLMMGIILTVRPPLYAVLVYRYVWYALTDRRAIIQTGLIGRDFKTVEYDQISNAEVNVGFWDKIFGTGSILMYTAGGAWATTYGRRGTTVKPPSINHVPSPYEVFKSLQDYTTKYKQETEGKKK